MPPAHTPIPTNTQPQDNDGIGVEGKRGQRKWEEGGGRRREGEGVGGIKRGTGGHEVQVEDREGGREGKGWMEGNTWKS